ncbi:hypothetical protein Bxe_A2722 [Paraburkholderia xenovorans LB400]|uniref:Uncharacterized protein n=1 Tax=Paraburkholderia xenovorans (strain LB400) TaxID=266265 RepID=Q140J7_PARXL|nr:hypothetical protein Bxe_A2722 [Paraburkholderia xenovorans LB400]
MGHHSNGTRSRSDTGSMASVNGRRAFALSVFRYFAQEAAQFGSARSTVATGARVAHERETMPLFAARQGVVPVRFRTRD